MYSIFQTVWSEKNILLRFCLLFQFRYRMRVNMQCSFTWIVYYILEMLSCLCVVQLNGSLTYKMLRQQNMSLTGTNWMDILQQYRNIDIFFRFFLNILFINALIFKCHVQTNFKKKKIEVQSSLEMEKWKWGRLKRTPTLMIGFFKGSTKIQSINGNMSREILIETPIRETMHVL